MGHHAAEGWYIHDLVKSFQPDILIVDHEGLQTPYDEDLVMYEEPRGGFAPAGNTRAAVQGQKINGHGGQRLVLREQHHGIHLRLGHRRYPHQYPRSPIHQFHLERPAEQSADGRRHGAVFGPVQARYVRLIALAVNSGTSAQATEVEVGGPRR